MYAYKDCTDLAIDLGRNKNSEAELNKFKDGLFGQLKQNEYVYEVSSDDDEAPMQVRVLSFDLTTSKVVHIGS